MPPIVQTTVLPIASNVFMTFACYGHLRDLAARPAWIAAMVRWGTPSLNRRCKYRPTASVTLGGIEISKLKILQEIIPLALFASFSV